MTKKEMTEKGNVTKRKVSEATRKKMSEAQKKSWAYRKSKTDQHKKPERIKDVATGYVIIGYANCLRDLMNDRRITKYDAARRLGEFSRNLEVEVV